MKTSRPSLPLAQRVVNRAYSLSLKHSYSTGGKLVPGRMTPMEELTMMRAMTNLCIPKSHLFIRKILQKRLESGFNANWEGVGEEIAIASRRILTAREVIPFLEILSRILKKEREKVFPLAEKLGKTKKILDPSGAGIQSFKYRLGHLPNDTLGNYIWALDKAIEFIKKERVK